MNNTALQDKSLIKHAARESQPAAGGYWQRKYLTSAGQSNYLLENMLYTDCVFLVGQSDLPNNKLKTFKAHKLLLAKASPVFAAMFFGPLAEKGDVYIKMEPNIFQIMLKFIYSEQLEFCDDVNILVEVCRAADMYDVPALIHTCVNKMIHKLQPANACQLYEVAQQLQCCIKIKDIAWKVIKEKTSEVVTAKSFSEASLSTLEAITSQDALNICSETQLIDCCFAWAIRAMEKRNLTFDLAGLQEALGPVLKNLRFLCITPSNFCQGFAKLKRGDSNIFTVEEVCSLLDILLHPKDQGVNKVLDIFSHSHKKRSTVHIKPPVIKFKDNISAVQSAKFCGVCKRIGNINLQGVPKCPNFNVQNAVGNQGQQNHIALNKGVFASVSFSSNCKISLIGVVVDDISNVEIQVLNEKCKQVIASYPKVSTADKEIKFPHPLTIEANQNLKIIITGRNNNIHYQAKLSKSVVANNIFTMKSIAANDQASLIKGIMYLKC